MQFIRGLRVQILLWTILPLILILVAVSLSSIKLHQDSMRDMVAERNAHVAGLAAARLDDQIRVRAIALDTFLRSVGEGANPEEELAELRPLLDLFDQGVILFDTDGTSMIQTPDDLLPSQEEIWEALLSSRAQPGQVTYQLVSQSGGARMFLISLTSQATKRSAVGIISQQGLNNQYLLDHVNRNPRREAYLIAQDGTVLYHQDEAEIGRDYLMHEGVEQALRGEAGATFGQIEGEEEHVVGYAPLLTTGWAILVEEPWADVIVPGLQYSLWAPILVLIAAVASLLAVQFGLGRIVHPLQVLGREASRLAWGDFQAIEKPVGGIAEIRDLQSTLQDMAAQIHRYQDGMRDYIAVLTQTQEDERKRLARELHDVIVQTVIAMGQRVKMLQLDWREQCGDCPRADPTQIDVRLSNLSEMVAQCLTDVRGMIRDLRPIYLDELGLVSALEALSRSTENENIETAFEVIGEERVLLREANLTVYRIAQAAISNAIRHGQPELIMLQLEFQETGVKLTVEDDGSGFIPPERPSDLALQGHFGLIGMYERATRMGGHLSIRSAPGSGTTITAYLPYELSSDLAEHSHALAV